jgi:hypothetical protein
MSELTSILFSILNTKKENTKLTDIMDLIEKGVLLTFNTKYRSTPLMSAIKNMCTIDVVKYIIEKGGIDWDSKIIEESFIMFIGHSTEYLYYNNLHMCLYKLYNYSTKNYNKFYKQISEEMFKQGYTESLIKIRNKGRKKIFDKKVYDLLLQYCEALNIKHWMLDKTPIQFPEKMCDVIW